jgi:cytochrome c peroxidase
MTTRRRRRAGWAACVAVVLSLPALSVRHAGSFPLYGDQTVLPPGTELNQDALNVPREQFRTEAVEGIRSYLVKLGDIAFNSPAIFGGVARQAGISCNSCHVNGTANPKFFMPGLSKHPGTFDTSGPLFNPKADNGFLDPVRIPSLRGARYLAPYGNDGRFASLRDFVHNVIVNEFAGPEPSPVMLDAIVAYIQDIDFLHNRHLGPAGRMQTTDEAELRGQALFERPFPHQPGLSCAGCHPPSAAFVDHRQHDVGSGGLFKTPPLLNANFNTPYFQAGVARVLEHVHGAAVGSALLVAVAMILGAGEGIGRAEAERQRQQEVRILIDQVLRMQQIARLGGAGGGLELGLAGRVQGFRIGAEIMVERGVLLVDDDHMLDRRLGRRTVVFCKCPYSGCRDGKRRDHAAENDWMSH